MFDLSKIVNEVSMTSLELAQVLNVRHVDLMRTAKRLCDDGQIRETPVAFSEEINNLGFAVNEVRVEGGESEIRHDQFLDRVEDELGDEIGQCENFALKPKNLKMKFYWLTLDQARVEDELGDEIGQCENFALPHNQRLMKLTRRINGSGKSRE